MRRRQVGQSRRCELLWYVNTPQLHRPACPFYANVVTRFGPHTVGVPNPACPKNTFTAVAGKACQACPANSDTTGTGSTTCRCKAGYASGGTVGESLMCTGTPDRPQWTMHTQHVLVLSRPVRFKVPSRCVACSPGFYAPAGQTSCSGMGECCLRTLGALHTMHGC